MQIDDSIITSHPASDVYEAVHKQASASIPNNVAVTDRSHDQVHVNETTEVHQPSITESSIEDSVATKGKGKQPASLKATPASEQPPNATSTSGSAGAEILDFGVEGISSALKA